MTLTLEEAVHDATVFSRTEWEGHWYTNMEDSLIQEIYVEMALNLGALNLADEMMKPLNRIGHLLGDDYPYLGGLEGLGE